MSKGLSYDTVMALPLEAIEQGFPHGAREATPNRFVPADGPENATKTLRRLRADKRKRQVEPPLLKPGSGYTTEPKFSLGKGRRHAGEFGEPEPAAVYPEDQRRFTAEARARDAGLAPPLSERLARLEKHAQPHQLESLERRIKGLERSLHDEAA